MSSKWTENWLDITGDHVELWEDADIISFLESTDDLTVTLDDEQVSLMNIIMEGRKGPEMQAWLSGAQSANERGARTKEETIVEMVIAQFICAPLKTIMGSSVMTNSYPIGRVATIDIRSRDKLGSIVNMPEHLAGMYKEDKVIQFTYADYKVGTASRKPQLTGRLFRHVRRSSNGQREESVLLSRSSRSEG